MWLSVLLLFSVVILVGTGAGQQISIPQDETIQSSIQPRSPPSKPLSRALSMDSSQERSLTRQSVPRETSVSTSGGTHSPQPTASAGPRPRTPAQYVIDSGGNKLPIKMVLAHSPTPFRKEDLPRSWRDLSSQLQDDNVSKRARSGTLHETSPASPLPQRRHSMLEERLRQLAAKGVSIAWRPRAPLSSSNQKPPLPPLPENSPTKRPKLERRSTNNLIRRGTRSPRSGSPRSGSPRSRSPSPPPGSRPAALPQRQHPLQSARPSGITAPIPRGPPQQSFSVPASPIPPRVKTSMGPPRKPPSVPTSPIPPRGKTLMGPPKGVPTLDSSGKRTFITLKLSPKSAAAAGNPEGYFPKTTFRTVTTGITVPLKPEPNNNKRKLEERGTQLVQRKANSAPPIMLREQSQTKTSPTVPAVEGLVNLADRPEVVPLRRSKRPRTPSTGYKYIKDEPELTPVPKTRRPGLRAGRHSLRDMNSGRWVKATKTAKDEERRA